MFSLLPIDPPKINSLILKRMQDLFKIGEHKLWVCRIKKHRLTRLGINSHASRKTLVSFFEIADSIRWMQVERSVQATCMKRGEEALGIWEELRIPGVSSPARACSFRRLSDMPIHVDHRDRHGDRSRSKIVHDPQIFFLGVSVIATPPIAQGKARKNRLRPAQAIERTNGLREIFACGKDINICMFGPRRQEVTVFTYRAGVIHK